MLFSQGRSPSPIMLTPGPYAPIAGRLPLLYHVNNMRADILISISLMDVAQ